MYMQNMSDRIKSLLAFMWTESLNFLTIGFYYEIYAGQTQCRKIGLAVAAAVCGTGVILPPLESLFKAFWPFIYSTRYIYCYI